MNVCRTRLAPLFALAALAALSSLTGCKSLIAPAPAAAAQADYSRTLNKYYEGRPLCLWPQTIKFPVEMHGQDTIDQLGLDELARSGLLLVKVAPKGSGRSVKSYDLTPEGRSALNPDIFNAGAGNFCYGRRTIVSIDAARRNSSTTELVAYHYRVLQPAAWAMEAPIQEAFPDLARELAEPHSAEATLLDTTDGWEISGTPAAIVPPVARKRTAAPILLSGLSGPKKSS